jgi:hypothetical protein
VPEFGALIFPIVALEFMTIVPILPLAPFVVVKMMVTPRLVPLQVGHCNVAFELRVKLPSAIQ